MESLSQLFISANGETLKNAGFFTFALITIFGAGYLLFTKNILYAAYGLLITFLGMAGLYVFAGADFVAVTQIMVYIGGVLVLMIFGIMLTQNNRKNAEESNAILVTSQRIARSLGVALLFFIALVLLIFDAHFTLMDVRLQQDTTIPAIGKNLMTEYLLIFEVVGILLLISLIGAAFVARKADDER